MQIQCSVCKEFKDVKKATLKRCGLTPETYRCRNCFNESRRQKSEQNRLKEQITREQAVTWQLSDMMRMRRERKK